ncbi:triphosphoribosyl-dephospho-CoA synthase MdcB [Paenibacillus sp. CFBP13512]|uniref:triphosphoribosyl-dephospho-CoA synthase n=1 Tax=Paenibacillus sp. CFBP13512 TaxID=2184007 RepID=UPI0010BF740C|nr:triphosphoribosyl-dephospho-CoA synthase [Paenibacillus sp. CFBP13512]TKJ90598.1 triphosphoribosyl-dephospho-CoA synthase MdcB [Paenibacillus sp. CFBP13512]
MSISSISAIQSDKNLIVNRYASWLGELAVSALRDEASLTPKPGLVDLHHNGSHEDMNIELMYQSAASLQSTFTQMAQVSYDKCADQSLREQLAWIGRTGEQQMLTVTKGVNTHRGAIWALGLLTGSASMLIREAYRNTEVPYRLKAISAEHIARTASEIAQYPDRYAPVTASHGTQVKHQYGTGGAKDEAQHGFPHVINVGLPALQQARAQGIDELYARLDSLLTIISVLPDTCLLYRGGQQALEQTQKRATVILSQGGTSTTKGWQALLAFDQWMVKHHFSPGGSADLLAATLYIDSILKGITDRTDMESLSKTTGGRM